MVACLLSGPEKTWSGLTELWAHRFKKGGKKKTRLAERFHEDFMVTVAPFQVLNLNSEDLCLTPSLTDYPLCLQQAGSPGKVVT